MPRNPGRLPLVAGNWKMHLTHLEAIALVQKLAYSLRAEDLAAVETVVLPAFTALRSVQTCVDGDHLALRYGAQDLAVEAGGAHTGDVSGPMLAALGCRYVVVGHSERRGTHHETDEVVGAKVAAAVAHGLTPILCVGEAQVVRDAGDAEAHNIGQLTAALAGSPTGSLGGIVVAYEPLWAIGTGRTATAGDAQAMAAALRSALAGMLSPALAAGVRVLYGGSVKAENAAELLAGADVDGALVGGASLDPVAFPAIVRAARPAALRDLTAP